MGRPRAATFGIVEIVSRGFAGSLILEQTDFVFRHTATGTNRSSFLYRTYYAGIHTIASSHEIWPTILPPSFLSLLLLLFEIESFEKRRGIDPSSLSSLIASYRISLFCVILRIPPSPSPRCMVKSHYRGSRNLTWFLLLLRDRSPIIISTSITPLLAMTSHGRGSKIEDRLGRKK